MSVQQMEYNSARENLIIPEYGRNVQKLIDHAKTIEDPAFRQAFVEKIIDLMMQMSPQSRNLEDYKEKLWKHVFRIANYQLDVIPPKGITPTPEVIEKRPEKIDYPGFEAKYRHYGHNVQKLIKKAKSMEEGSVKSGFIGVIGSYMKLAYRTWNKEHYVSDDIIKQDLETLSNGDLTLDENISLDNLTNANKKRKRSNNNNNKSRNKNRKRHK
ncbi:MAG: DUF4290 domain-containing protein [Bacteroidota bacterium]